MTTDPETLMLRRLATAAASTEPLHEALRLVVAQTAEALDSEVCSVYLLDAGGGRLCLEATTGLPRNVVGRVRLALGEGVTGWAAQERRPIVVADVRWEPRFRWIEGVDQARLLSMCSVPITSGDRLEGVVNVQAERARRFTGAEVRLVVAVAAEVARLLARSPR